MDYINCDEDIEQIVEKYAEEYKLIVEKTKYDLYVFLNDLKMYHYVTFQQYEIDKILKNPVDNNICIAGELEYALIGNCVRKY